MNLQYNAGLTLEQRCQIRQAQGYVDDHR